LAEPAADWDGDAVYNFRDDEWVEIVNTGPGPVVLDGYRLASADSVWRYEFSGSLDPGAHAVVYGSESYAWEQSTGYPIPLGGIIMRRHLHRELSYLIEEKIRESIRYAQMHPEEPRAYIRRYAQEMDESVARQHIDLYVNEYSLDIGTAGEQAIRFLLAEAEKKGLIPPSRHDIF